MAATKKKASTARKAKAKKPAAKKTTVRKVTKKAPARKTAAKKTTTRKAAPKKTTTRKTAAKKTTAKKPAAKKTTAKKAVAKKPAKLNVTAPLTKSQLFALIAEQTGESKSSVSAIYDSLTDVIAASLKKGKGKERTFTLPGLVKFVVLHKPAKKARKGVNPFTGEEMMFKAKPAHDVVKVRILKKVKEMV